MTEAKPINYNSTNRVKYYEPQKEKSYTEKTTTTYPDMPDVDVEIEASNGKKYYNEIDDEIDLVDASSASSYGMWVVNKKTNTYYEVDLSNLPSIPGGGSMLPTEDVKITETLQGYYKIGANTYYAECFVSTTTFAGMTFKSAEIYCYNGGHYPVYIVDLAEGYDMDKDGNVITVMEETSTTKVDFKDKADASLMDFNKVLKPYKYGGKKTLGEIMGELNPDEY